MPHAVQLRSAELAAASRAAVNDEHWDRAAALADAESGAE
jgi:DnaJ-domain-containing protein 1